MFPMDREVCLHIAIYEVNGQTVIRADSDGDGNFDTQLTPDGNGNLIMETKQGTGNYYSGRNSAGTAGGGC